jgi:uncharacterized protein YggU (UPF0235/DUF167 family)
VPRECARVVRGRTSPRKTLEIRGVSEAQVRERVGRRIAPGGRSRPPG